MKVKEFALTTCMEGLSYALTDYYSIDTLNSLEDDDVRKAAIEARKALDDLNEAVHNVLGYSICEAEMMTEENEEE